jgi:serine protease inhibitor
VHKPIFCCLILSFLLACGQEKTNSIPEVSAQQISIENELPQSFLFQSYANREPDNANQQEIAVWVEQINRRSFLGFSTYSVEKNFFNTAYLDLSLVSLLTLSANGTSSSQLDEFLGSDNPLQADLFLSTINSLDLQLNRASIDSNSTFSSATYLWGDKYYDFSSEFLDNTVRYFNAELNNTNFVEQAQEVSLQYNALLQTNTQSLLPRNTSVAISSEMSTSILLLSQMSLLNAKWQYPFDSTETQIGDFRLSDGNIIEVPMMKLELDTQYFANDSSLLVALPTQDPNWSVYFLTSKVFENHSAFKANLSAEKFQTMLQQSRLSQVIIILPSFSLNLHRGGAKTSLNSVSLSEELSTIFSTTVADLSRLSTQANSDPYVSKIETNSSIILAEQGVQVGSEAKILVEKKPLPVDTFSSGVTITSSFGSSSNAIVGLQTQVVNFDSPFLFFIRHNPTGAILYSGQVSEPKI